MPLFDILCGGDGVLIGLTGFRGGYARMNCALTGHTDIEVNSNGFKCDVYFCCRSKVFP